VIAPTPTMWRGMASPTLSGKHSHRGAWYASYSGHCLIVAHLIWREPRAPVLLLVDPCSYFLGRGYLVWNKPNGARASCSPAATWACAWDEGRSRRCAVHCQMQQGSALADTGEQHARGPFGLASAGLGHPVQAIADIGCNCAAQGGLVACFNR
jgi:hypothetical protein